ncbi:N-acetyltransferase [Pseudomonas sp. PSB18]|uniref:N-acetyltransferase n=2 Tax=unclassified Pseudomonas TaxID=196821 RepID=UPI0016618992|nr:N-acetyltransferase [Pseudomonas sp. PSB18]MBD0684072.1 N-acetyltransferase [Pseudomonas sp. PSB18]
MRKKGKGTDLRNQILKSEARKLAHRTVSNDPDAQEAGVQGSALKLEPITSEAINACHSWEEKLLYPWHRVPDWKRRDAKGLDIAIWHREVLCGLCYATPRKSTVRLKIVLLQGSPDHTHPLRGWVASIALLTTEFYARMLDCNQIEVQEPEAGAIPYYLKLGFSFDAARRLVISLDAP